MVTAVSTQGQSLELGDPPVEGQFTAYGATLGGSEFGLPMATGDFNGDSFLDLVQSPMLSDVLDGDTTRNRSGLAYVTFGNGEISGFVDFASPPANTAILLGARANDIAGNEVWAGDVNGDGIDDLLLCAQATDGPDGTRSVAGSLYIVFGHEGFSGTYDLLDPPPFVTQIHGAEAGDRLGIWIRTGDLNGDGIDDILIGADQADRPGNTTSNAGSAYILYGTDTWSATMDLAVPPAGRTVLFHGVDVDDHFGSTVNIADINGDGKQDALISASLIRSGASAGGTGNANGQAGDGPPGSFRLNAGESYVFFNPGVWPNEIDAASPPVSVSMTIVYGEIGEVNLVSTADFMGEEILGADLNGDGSDELVLGGITASRIGRSFVGITYILEGGLHLENRRIDLLNPPDDFDISVIIGAGAGDISGDTIIAGYVDNDGYEDLIVGSPNHDGPRGGNQGRLDVLFGRETPFPALFDLASIPEDLRHVKVFGPGGGDIRCYSMAIGDWDNDGFEDPMPNGMGADGFDGAFSNAGDGYVISGAFLSELAPTFTATPTASEAPLPTATPTPTRTPTRSADFNNADGVNAVDLLILLEAFENE